jgi:putative membrane protein insertion efficiency factor
MTPNQLVEAVLRSGVRLYQIAISPVFPACCRFDPSCSQYAIEALAEHGAWRGVWLTLRRIARCHPFGASGWDPVPRGGPRGS